MAAFKEFHKLGSESHCLSKFGQVLLSASPLPYVSKVIQHLQSQFHEEHNPSGKILMCTAENKLVSDLMLQQIQFIFSSSHIPAAVLNYTHSAGLPTFRAKIATFLSHFLYHDRVEVDFSHLYVGSGCVAMLTSLSLLLFEPGDAVLIPVPYYPAFDHDFYNFAHAVVCPIHGTNVSDELPFGLLTEEALQASYLEAIRSGHRPKAILLSNPNNPLGTLYSSSELRMVVQFVQKNPEIHLIMDEIYSLSVFPAHAHSLDIDDDHGASRFISVVELAKGHLGNNIHLVWSFSKDFAASGLRVGVLYSQNQDLLTAMAACNEPMMASNLTQYCFEQMLNNESFILSYLRQNRELLFQSYNYLRRELAELNVSVLNAQGGIFVFADFRFYLPPVGTATYRDELELFEYLADAGAIFTPGESCHCPFPGFFRICYAFVPLNTLRVAIHRLKSALPQWKFPSK